MRKNRLTKKYNLFEPTGEGKGAFVNHWKLRLNIEEAAVSDIING